MSLSYGWLTHQCSGVQWKKENEEHKEAMSDSGVFIAADWAQEF